MGSAGPVVLGDVSLTLLLQGEWPSGTASSLSWEQSLLIWVELPSWNAALSPPSLPTGGTDPPPMSACPSLEQRCGPQRLQPLASQPPSQWTPGAIGQVTQRTGNSLITDEKGDKTVCGSFEPRSSPFIQGNSTRNWDGQKVHLGFSQAATEKSEHILANPNTFLFIFPNDIFPSSFYQIIVQLSSKIWDFKNIFPWWLDWEKRRHPSVGCLWLRLILEWSGCWIRFMLNWVQRLYQ